MKMRKQEREWYDKMDKCIGRRVQGKGRKEINVRKFK
jgi:hypothetical protein